jgi:energy-coupling factor transport system ATP-binding protein
MVRTFIDSDFATHPRDLSEGQKLLAVFALAIAHQPKKIYLDEPTRGLDNHMRELLRQTLVRLSDTTDIVIATHDIDFAQSLSRTIIQMEGVYA